MGLGSPSLVLEKAAVLRRHHGHTVPSNVAGSMGRGTKWTQVQWDEWHVDQAAKQDKKGKGSKNKDKDIEKLKAELVAAKSSGGSAGSLLPSSPLAQLSPMERKCHPHATTCPSASSV